MFDRRLKKNFNNLFCLFDNLSLKIVFFLTINLFLMIKSSNRQNRLLKFISKDKIVKQTKEVIEVFNHLFLFLFCGKWKQNEYIINVSKIKTVVLTKYILKCLIYFHFPIHKIKMNNYGNTFNSAQFFFSGWNSFSMISIFVKKLES